MNVDKIELRAVLPQVFVGMEHEPQIERSEIWLRDVSLERGHRYLIEAESGNGKSSLCSYIYGHRGDYQGEICFDGINIRKFTRDDWSAIRCSTIALLPQEMRLFPELNVWDNIQIKNRLTGCLADTEIRDMLAMLGIADKEHSLAAHLSIGQQQRVAIVRTLCQPFGFVLLDEPVSHLDAHNNRLVAEMVMTHASRYGAAVIATSVGNHLMIPNPTVLHL